MVKMRALISTPALFLLFCSAWALQDSDPVNICSSNKTLGSAIIAAVNLTYPGLERVAAAAHQGQLGLACELLAGYYVNSTSGSWYRVPPVTPGTGRAGGKADAALEDIFTLSGVQETAKIPRNPDGGLDWYYEGPRKDPEFMNCLNRHEYFQTLQEAWQQTGNPIYAAKYGDLVTDWVLHLPCNPCTTGTMESPWRILEVGIRTADYWPETFYGFQGCSAFNTTARVLMLLGFHEHGITLMKYGTEGFANWRVQQWSGLGSIALAFPELNGSEEWLAKAVAGLEAEIKSEVYADGVETEQTSGYDGMTADNFYRLLWILAQAGRPAPASFSNAVENMYNYLAFSIDQQGYLPRNGDSDYIQAWVSNTRKEIKDHFNRSDWEYVYSGGTKGSKPSGSASVMFPWAGQFVMKSGYTAGDQWAFFDVGPYGSSGHGHRDKLHLNIRAYESLLLVDSGRFTYQGQGSIFHSVYAPSTRAHNTLTIDHCNQLPDPATVNSSLDRSTWSIGDTNDYARGSMSAWDNLNGTATHTRAVLYRKGDWWVVVDAVDTGRRPRHIQATWHAHPNSTVTTTTGGAAVVTGVPHGQIAVIPAAGTPWKVSVVKGQQPPADPYFQGWFSASYLDCETSPTLVYDMDVTSDPLYLWLLLPAPTVGPVSAGVALVSRDSTSVTVKVSVAGQPDVIERIVVWG